MKKSTDTSPVNMTKQFRAELKTLRARARSLKKESREVIRDNKREVSRLNRECDKILFGITKESAAVDKRRLVLEGRLSK